jgi:hypothetical protein
VEVSRFDGSICGKHTMSRASDGLSPKRLFLFAFAVLACPFAARAVDLSLKLEPGGALSLGRPQSQRFGLGGAASLKALVGLEGGYLNLTAGLTSIESASPPPWDSLFPSANRALSGWDRSFAISRSSREAAPASIPAT